MSAVRRVALVIAVLAAVVTGCGREPTPQRDSTPPRVEARAEARRHLISEDELEVLRAWGLPDPLQQLVASLGAHPELISHPGVLGGRMGFYSKSDICVLNAAAAIARFTDGHIEGSGVFGFSIDDDGSIHWRVLTSRIEGPPLEMAPSAAPDRRSGSAISVSGLPPIAGGACR